MSKNLQNISEIIIQEEQIDHTEQIAITIKKALNNSQLPEFFF